MEKDLSDKANSTYEKNLIINGVPVIYDIEHFRRLIGMEKKYFYRLYHGLKYHYRNIRIPKRKVGEYRDLLVPSKNLKKLQRWILEYILYSTVCEDNITGFVPTKLVVDNAIPHLKCEYLYKFDIEDFFPSISRKKVFYLFRDFGYTKELSNYLASLCCFEEKLPQGAPTSPYIANLVCRKLDKRLINLCQKNSFVYTRYADDITISGNKNIFHFKKFFIDIIEDSGFNINNDKTRLIRNGQQKLVTGIVVNEKISVPRSYVRKIKQELFYIQRYGIKNHLEHLGCDTEPSDYYKTILGKINYIKMIDSELGRLLNEQLDLIKELDF